MMRAASIGPEELGEGTMTGLMWDGMEGLYCVKNGVECVFCQDDSGWTWYANEKDGSFSTSTCYFGTLEGALADFNENVDTDA